MDPEAFIIVLTLLSVFGFLGHGIWRSHNEIARYNRESAQRVAKPEAEIQPWRAGPEC